MAPESTSHRMRRAALERRQVTAAVTAVSTGAMAQSGSPPQSHKKHETPAPPLENTFPSVENTAAISTGATSASGSQERPPALSIHYKKTKLPDMVDMTTGNATTAQREVVVGTKTKYLVRTNNNQGLQVPYFKRYRGPVTRELRSLLSRDIGSIIRSKVLMLAPSFLGLKHEPRDILNNGIETNYDIPPTKLEMWNFIDVTAQTIYKDWKYDCHQHYLHVSQETLAEYLGREEE